MGVQVKTPFLRSLLVANQTSNRSNLVAEEDKSAGGASTLFKRLTRIRALSSFEATSKLPKQKYTFSTYAPLDTIRSGVQDVAK